MIRYHIQLFWCRSPQLNSLESWMTLIFLHFNASGIKGLIIKNAQGISLGTLFKIDHTHPIYNKSQRKNFIRPNQVHPMAPGLSGIICQTTVNLALWKKRFQILKMNICLRSNAPWYLAGICKNTGCITKKQTKNKYSSHKNQTRYTMI